MDLKIDDRLRMSIDKAFEFIINNRNPDGFWSDFRTLAGESVYWVSGYIGFALSRYGEKHVEDRLNEIGANILERQSENGGWGYGPGVPADADSTSWCLLFLSRLGIQSSESREKALSFLLKHQNPLDGGFRTYAMPREVGRFMMLDENVSFEGWASSHMCVTAVAAQALVETDSSRGINESIDCIRRGQTTEGYWNPYWWNEKLYSTVNCMEVMKSLGKENDESLIKAHNWIANTQLNDGGWSDSTKESLPFSTALGIRGLLLIPRQSISDKIRNGVEWLFTHQLTDGSWDSNHILKIPHPSMKEPWRQTHWKRDGRAINSLIKDHRRLYTTATVLIALSEFQKFSRDEMK
jgi:squalene cyclase